MGYDKMYISNDEFIVDEILKSENVGDISIGRKYDGNKLEYGLLPPLALEATVDVLTFGAQKYERDNWKKVPDSKRRYFDALERHVWAWKKGEKLDPESGKHHLAHALCCLMFLYEHDILYSVDEQINYGVEK
jgi:hypothetical protein